MAYSHELPPFFCLLFFWGCPGIPQVSWKLYVLTQDEGLPTLLRRAFNVSPHKFGVVFFGGCMTLLSLSVSICIGE